MERDRRYYADKLLSNRAVSVAAGALLVLSYIVSLGQPARGEVTEMTDAQAMADIVGTGATGIFVWSLYQIQKEREQTGDRERNNKSN